MAAKQKRPEAFIISVEFFCHSLFIHDSPFQFQVSTILQQCSVELCTPQLKVSVFDTKGNELAKEGMKARVSYASILLT